MDQVTILRTLIQGEEGREWADKRNQGWTAPSSEQEADVCSWEGVECDGASLITSLTLTQSDLLATIPTEFGLLTMLSKIDLKKNLLYGSIPTEFANMPSLVDVNLQENQLTGTLVPFKSKIMDSLDLSHNRFHDVIPPDFGIENKELNYLDLQHNRLVGYLPFGLEDLHKLQTISLSFNQLSGTLPPYVFSMSQLKYLYLNDNRLVGTAPTVDDATTNTLEEIWLQNNLLSGTIPSSWSKCTALHDLYLDGNRFTGTVPSPLCIERINADFFETENDRNFCDSISCPAGTDSDYGIFPCRNCTSTLENPYLGRKGECDNWTEARVVALLLGEGITGALPSACSYPQVTCHDTKVIEIDAHNTGLTGTIPDELGLLKGLRVLNLEDNFLTGFLPSGLRFAPLEILRIGGNLLKGTVPPLLCEEAKNINGGYGKNNSSCTSIACPMGSYSKNNGGGFGDCTPCADGAFFLASKSCIPASSTTPIADDSSSDSLPLPFLFVGVGLLILAGAILAMWAIMYNRYRARQKRQIWGGGVVEDTFPTVQDVHNVKRRRLYGGKWLMNRLSRSFHYAISLTETEAINDPPGAQPFSDGEIDDYGWRERESIIRHRDLENAVNDAIGTEVWEYPDPLERPVSYNSTSFSENDDFEFAIPHVEEVALDDDDDDLAAWIEKQKNDPATAEVWLDVPRIE